MILLTFIFNDFKRGGSKTPFRCKTKQLNSTTTGMTNYRNGPQRAATEEWLGQNRQELQ